MHSRLPSVGFDSGGRRWNAPASTDPQLPTTSLVIQPSKRGTAPAILQQFMPHFLDTQHAITIHLGARNLYWETDEALTGEISSGQARYAVYKDS